MQMSAGGQGWIAAAISFEDSIKLAGPSIHVIHGGAALQLLIEGNSLRSTERITGVDINTLMKLLVRAGGKCEKLMGRLIVNIPVKDVQCDEIWAFVYKNEKNKTPFESENDGLGDAYCFVAMER